MARLTPSDWVRAAAEQMASAGVDSVRVERLAKSLKVSKGSFYWHFRDRAALLAEVLSTWERQSTLAIIADVERQAQSPEAKLWALFEEAFGGPAEHDALETALRTWAGQDEQVKGGKGVKGVKESKGVKEVKEVVHRVDRQRLRFVTELLEAAGLPHAEASRRSELLYCALIGESVRRSYGKPKLSRAALRSLHTMLLLDT